MSGMLGGDLGVPSSAMQVSDLGTGEMAVLFTEKGT